MERKVVLFSVGNVVMEYTVAGEGIPVLVMHGGHSSCKEDFGHHLLIENGFSVITPTRTGYGKTSKKLVKI